MGIKTKIKNDLWRVNYIVPFAKKHLNDEVGKFEKARSILAVASGKRVVRGHGPRSVAGDTLTLFSRVRIDVDPSSSFVYSIDEDLTLAVPGNVLSNFTVDSAPLIDGSLAGIIDDACSCDDAFGKSASTVVDALSVLCDRTVRAIEVSGLSSKEKETRSRWFRDMLHRPASSFREGLQRVLFLNQVLWQTRHRLNGLGRLDKLLGDLYVHDVGTGAIAREGALALVSDFLKCLHGHYEYKSDALLGDIGQIIILGGLEPDGSYFRNDLTDVFLEAQAASGYPDPKIFLRCSASMPRDLMERAVLALRSATGSPLFSNDDRVVPALESFGVQHEDARAYCVSACWEPLVPGRSLGQNNMLVFDAGASVSDALSRLPDDAGFSELKKAFEESLSSRFGSFLSGLDEFRWAEDPLVSLFYPDCIRSRIDVSQGASRYRNYGITVVGVANAVDSLANARTLLSKGVGADGLRRLLGTDSNIEGEELCTKSIFGTDSPDAIETTNWITGIMDQAAERYVNPLGGKVKFGLSSPAYIMVGRSAPADLSGRMDGDPYTVHISNASAAPTELVNFAGALDYSGHRFNGNVVDFFVAPSLLENEVNKFTDFMMAALSVGFFQMQMNVMDSATLIDAKANPERYPGLIVRVWGFSAYFNDLPESYKDYLIERARETEAAA